MLFHSTFVNAFGSSNIDYRRWLQLLFSQANPLVHSASKILWSKAR